MSSTPVRLADVVPFSWVDGPGNRFVIFTQGCSFNCLACHNPETITPRGPATSDSTVEEMLERIRVAEPYLSGVTVSGGEATGQWRFVRDLFTAIRADPQLSRLTTFVDTNGHALGRVWDELLPVTDGFMVDLKALDPEVHEQLTRTAAWLADLDPDLRIVVIGFRQHGVRAEWADIPQARPELLDRARRALEDAGMTDVVTV